MKTDDMDWLYRDEDESDKTRVMPRDEQSGYPTPPPPQQGWTAAPPPPPSGGYPVGQPQQYAGQGQYQGAQRGHHGGQPPMPPAPPKERRRRRKKRRPLRKLIGTLFLLWLVFLIATPIVAFLRTETVETSASTLAGQPGNAVLLVGSDGRDNLSDEDRRRLGTGSTEGQRTDTIMLLYTAPDGRSAILGFPRDSYVEIPGRGKNKINAAYAFGGPSLLVETVEQNTGLKVDGYLEIGMLGLVDMVDAVGGIEVCPEQAIKDKDSHLDIPGGCQQVDGVTALNYARMRKADPRGDIGRMERQREVIGELVKGIAHPLTFVNPKRYWDVNMAAAASMRRSEGTDVLTLAGAGGGLASGLIGRSVNLTVPISSTGTRTSAGSSVIWDEGAAQEVFDAIATGDMDALEQHS